MAEKRALRLYGLAIYIAGFAFLLPRAGMLARRDVANETAITVVEALALLGLDLFVKASVLVVVDWRRRRAGMLDL